MATRKILKKRKTAKRTGPRASACDSCNCDGCPGTGMCMCVCTEPKGPCRCWCKPGSKLPFKKIEPYVQCRIRVRNASLPQVAWILHQLGVAKISVPGRRLGEPVSGTFKGTPAEIARALRLGV